MSDDRKDAVLIARAGAGVRIRVLDSNLDIIGSGLSEVRVSAKEGLYSVEYSSAGTRTERIVKLTSANSPLEVSFDPSATTQSGGSASWPPPELVSNVGDTLRPSERAYGSSIVVITSIDANPAPATSSTTEGNEESLTVPRPPPLPIDDSAVDIRIATAKGRLLRSNRKDAPPVNLGSGDSAHCYRVRPGRYHLRYRSILGDTVEQSVAALPGRQTIVFLRISAAHLLVAKGPTFERTESAGVDPAKSVMISVAGDEQDSRIRERARLAGVLLHDLATGTGSLSHEFVRILDDPLTDPLLKLYAAHVVLSRLDRGLSPAADEPMPEGTPLSGAASDVWLTRAVDWLGDPSAVGMPSDATAACWHLQDEYRSSADLVGAKAVPRRIQVAPMLERSWSWAIARSIRSPEAVFGTTSLLAAGRSAAGTAPWLCWKAAAATAAPNASRRSESSDLRALVREVAEKTKRLMESVDLTDATPELLETLSPDATATAIRVNQIVNTDPSIESDEDAPLDLALALKMPATQLKRHLASASAEIDLALALQSARPPGERARSASGDPWSYEDAARADAALPRGLPDGAGPDSARAPGLSEQVREPDDPHKGRFGGLAAQGGFRAKAAFHQRSANWTDIRITVTGKAADGQIVRFYLHDSFRPAERTETFREGQASIKVTAWGGFTVGIWIPSARIQLELDLADVAGAPHNIRTR